MNAPFFVLALLGVLTACVSDEPPQVTQQQAAQPELPCAPREVVLENLARKYGERTIAYALNYDGRVLEVLTTKNGETWTAIITDPRGISCFLGAGEHWTVAEQGTKAQYTDHPHDHIRQHRTPNGMSCCHGSDASEIPYDTAVRLRVGDMMFLPRFNRSVPVRVIHPSPPDAGLKAWGTTFGCLFVPQMF